MRDKRVLSTAFIWLFLFLITEKITSYGNTPFDATVAVIFLIVAAMLSTGCVWYFGSEAFLTDSEKAKNESVSDARLRLLLELMDEKEKARLKARLLNEYESRSSDGELSLEMLLKR